ncbi:MAG: hypothetical protein ACLQPD_03140, partial [Desulfomonilaceae bacterium]
MRIQLNSIRILRVWCFLTVLVIACGHGLAQFSHASQTPIDFQKQFNLPQDPDSLLKEILSRKEFTDAAKESFLDRFIDYLNYLWRKALSWLLDRWPDLEPFSFGNESVWAAVGIILLTTILALIIFRLARFLSGVSKKSRAKQSEFSDEPIELGDLGEMQGQAVQLAHRGEYRQALILLFRFVLLRLDELGRINWHPCKTNREILRSADRTPLTHDPLSEMISMFNGIYYGD